MFQATVTSTSLKAGNVKLIQLAASDQLKTRLQETGAGAHVDLVLDDGLVRQYSAFGLDANGSFSIAVKLQPDSRGGSARVHDRIKAGQEVQIAAVRNHFHLAFGSRPVLIAAGIGITPILSMRDHLRREGADYRLLYVCRAGEAAFGSELASDRKVQILEGANREDIRQVVQSVTEDLGDGTVYTCGPTSFMETVEVIVGERHGAGRVKSEAFSGKIVDGARVAFSVVLASSGAEYRIESDQSILDVLRAEGLTLPSSCEEGVCGSCLTGLLDGEAIHNDSVLTNEEKAEQRDICLCVSRSAGGTLTLDL